MELKTYQQEVIRDLKNFLQNMNELQSVRKAYNKLWEDKEIKVGEGVREYQATIPNTPHVCFKVPTGGGKTLLACASIKPIFEALTYQKTNVVIWLVPSDTILRQTINNLKNVNHDYRQYIDRDFRGRVTVYSKEEALQGQNFSPSAIKDNLSIFVLSYDSIRTTNKEGRKVYQQNGALASFNENSLYEGYHVQYKPDEDEPSLMAVLRSFNPVVIVDESHHAQTELSLAMLKSFNPSFVLDLTATPRENSNIISIVGAYKLKKEHMVKLPVIVKNQRTVTETIQMAINMQRHLEKVAELEKEQTGNYIRPIVLFQAQSHISDESIDFQIIKEQLIACGIPKEQIAIKTANVNELNVGGKDVDLLDKNCPIRYIITVNALKEGWDCPFAYILASLANRTSSVDVEQIVGRILRLPNVRENKNKLLNNSYVFTSSADFQATLENIVAGLNNAGFSKKDFRGKNYEEPQSTIPEQDIFSNVGAADTQNEETEQENGTTEDAMSDFMNIETSESLFNEDVPDMENFLQSAVEQGEEYSRQIDEETDNGVDVPNEAISPSSRVRVKEEFAKDIRMNILPKCYFYEAANSLDDEYCELVTKDDLTKGFKLALQNVEIDFSNIQSQMYKLDVENSSDDVPKRCLMTEKEQQLFKQVLHDMPSESQKVQLSKKLVGYLDSKYNALEAKDIKDYVERIVNSMSTEQIGEFIDNYLVYQERIVNKIEGFLEKYRKEQFIAKLRSQEIIIKFDEWHYREQAIVKDNQDGIAKGLYSGEGKMDDLETKFIEKVAGMDNVKWWHRNGQNQNDKNAFSFNGYINHYPDFMIMTKKGHLVCAETKGDQYNKDESQFNKALLGYLVDKNDNNPNFDYFMVFKNLPERHEGCITEQEFFEILKKW